MCRGFLVVSLIFCLIETDAEASGWAARGWYVQAPYSPGPGEQQIAGASVSLAGPYRSKAACETARLNLTAANAACHYYRRIRIIDIPPSVDTMPLAKNIKL